MVYLPNCPKNYRSYKTKGCANQVFNTQKVSEIGHLNTFLLTLSYRQSRNAKYD